MDTNDGHTASYAPASKQKGGILLKHIKWMTLLLCALLATPAFADNQYYAVREMIEIASADTITLTLDAQEGWMWNIADNTDVTAWFVCADGTPAFADESGIASGKLVYGKVEGEEDEVPVALEISIDASKITGFSVNGSYDLYIMPTGKSTIWVCGENHGQYVDSRELVGLVQIPSVSVEGKLTANAGMQLEVTNGTVQLVLTMDGLDDSLIDSSAAQIALLPGDGYKLYEVSFGAGSLSDAWSGGKADYTMGEISGTFSPQGGDGNGHYDFRIGIGGLRYNGLPLSEAIVRTDFYSFGRTFSVDGGSLILDTEPVWSSEADIPVLCDAYPDTVSAHWPIAFDASGVTAQDVRTGRPRDAHQHLWRRAEPRAGKGLHRDRWCKPHGYHAEHHLLGLCAGLHHHARGNLHRSHRVERADVCAEGGLHPRVRHRQRLRLLRHERWPERHAGMDVFRP